MYRRRARQTGDGSARVGAAGSATEATAPPVLERRARQPRRRLRPCWSGGSVTQARLQPCWSGGLGNRGHGSVRVGAAGSAPEKASARGPMANSAAKKASARGPMVHSGVERGSKASQLTNWAARSASARVRMVPLVFQIGILPCTDGALDLQGGIVPPTDGILAVEIGIRPGFDGVLTCPGRHPPGFGGCFDVPSTVSARVRRIFRCLPGPAGARWNGNPAPMGGIRSCAMLGAVGRRNTPCRCPWHGTHASR